MGNQIPNRVNSHTPHAFTSDHPLRLIEDNFSTKLPDTSNNYDNFCNFSITSGRVFYHLIPHHLLRSYGKMSSEKNFKNRGDGKHAGGTDWDWGLKKTPLCNERGSPVDRKQCYLFPLLDALSGLIFAFEEEEALITCDAKLQSPVFHFSEGSGQAVQYHLEENSALRLQPLHFSTISWQIPPL